MCYSCPNQIKCIFHFIKYCFHFAFIPLNVNGGISRRNCCYGGILLHHHTQIHKFVELFTKTPFFQMFVKTGCIAKCLHTCVNGNENTKGVAKYSYKVLYVAFWSVFLSITLNTGTGVVQQCKEDLLWALVLQHLAHLVVLAHLRGPDPPEGNSHIVIWVFKKRCKY